jgi:hypothetical protein
VVLDETLLAFLEESGEHGLHLLGHGGVQRLEQN